MRPDSTAIIVGIGLVLCLVLNVTPMFTLQMHVYGECEDEVPFYCCDGSEGCQDMTDDDDNLIDEVGVCDKKFNRYFEVVEFLTVQVCTHISEVEAASETNTCGVDETVPQNCAKVKLWPPVATECDEFGFESDAFINIKQCCDITGGTGCILEV